MKRANGVGDVGPLFVWTGVNFSKLLEAGRMLINTSGFGRSTGKDESPPCLAPQCRSGTPGSGRTEQEAAIPV